MKRAMKMGKSNGTASEQTDDTNDGRIGQARPAPRAQSKNRLQNTITPVELCPSLAPTPPEIRAVRTYNISFLRFCFQRDTHDHSLCDSWNGVVANGRDNGRRRTRKEILKENVSTKEEIILGKLFSLTFHSTPADTVPPLPPAIIAWWLLPACLPAYLRLGPSNPSSPAQQHDNTTQWPPVLFLGCHHHHHRRISAIQF